MRQARSQGDYIATAKLASLGLSFLSSTGIVDIAEPLLERLAKDSGELVRLSIVDDDRLIWVAKAQGTRKGLRYDPDMGMDARLSCTASGHAWLLTLSDERALELVSRQGFGQPEAYGPKAPTTVKALLGVLHAARTRGYAMIDEVFAPGMSAHRRAGAARPRGGGRDQHRRAAPAAHAGTHAAAGARDARGRGGTRSRSAAPRRCSGGRSWASRERGSPAPGTSLTGAEKRLSGLAGRSQKVHACPAGLTTATCSLKIRNAF